MAGIVFRQPEKGLSAYSCLYALNLAGEEGFEPSHAGIKIQCLNRLTTPQYLEMECLAGEEGFEPSHAGIKIQCLRPLDDSPTVFIMVKNESADYGVWGWFCQDGDGVFWGRGLFIFGNMF